MTPLAAVVVAVFLLLSHIPHGPSQAAVQFAMEEDAIVYCVGEPDPLTEETTALPVWWKDRLGDGTIETAVLHVDTKTLDITNVAANRDATVCPSEWRSLDPSYSPIVGSRTGLATGPVASSATSPDPSAPPFTPDRLPDEVQAPDPMQSVFITG